VTQGCSLEGGIATGGLLYLEVPQRVRCRHAAAGAASMHQGSLQLGERFATRACRMCRRGDHRTLRLPSR
jgi:hypothetical protein